MGEEARSRGIEAEQKAIPFIRSLGYEICEALCEEYDIDCIANFRSGSPQRKSLKRPRFSPDGLTAFEITSKRVSTKKFTDFSGKIRRYNTAHSNAPIVGGVLLTDKDVSKTMYDSMRNENIFGWGPHRYVFYKQKVRIFGSWSALHGTTTEISIDDTTSYLRCFCPHDEKLLFRFAIFFDDHARVFSVSKVKDIMEKIKEDSLFPLIDRGMLPINVLFEYHALGGIRDLRGDLLNFANKWKEEEITIFLPEEENPFKNYRTFPAL